MTPILTRIPICVYEFCSEKLEDKEGNDLTISKDNIKKIEASIKEMIGNAVEHAYPENYKYDKQWVLFAQYNHDRNEFVIIISDSGLSIPITFVSYHKEDPDFKERIKSSLINDTRLVKMAVQESGSGTDKGGRGNGLSWVEESVQEYGGGLVIYSKNGCYISEGTTVFILPIKLSERINGTIVNILLPLDSLI